LGGALGGIIFYQLFVKSNEESVFKDVIAKATEIVDKVEIVKGSGSVQYGSDALTGVINVITTNPQFKEKSTWNGQLTSRLTGFGMEKTVRPELSFSSKKIAFIAGVSNKQFGDLRGGDTTGFQSPSGYKELSWDAKLRFNLGQGWDLTASHQQLTQSNVPVYHKYILENFAINNSDPLKRSFSYITLKKNFESSFFKSLTSYVSTQKIYEHRNSRKNGSQILKLEDDQAETISSGIHRESVGLSASVAAFRWQPS
jgi:outer membrane receptor protein involved in Fe transport